jgi:hypothetical protein
MRPRSRAVALSVSLVIAASGTAAASQTPRPSSRGGDPAPALSQDAGPGLADDSGSEEDSSSQKAS